MLASEHKIQIKNAVLSSGYTREMIREDFYFQGRTGRARADLMVFGDIRHFDPETACIGIHFSDGNKSKILQDFRMMAIPFGIIADDRKLEIWPIGHKGPDERRKEECTWAQLSDYFTQNRIRFAPSTIIKAKEEGRQLSFADLDLGSIYEWSFDANKKELKLRIETAIENAKTKLSPRHFNQLTKITIRLLAASILFDKGYILLAPNQKLTAQSLLNCAREVYPNYFSVNDLTMLDPMIIERILEDLRAGGCIFTNLTTEMLDHLYQYAFVDEESRKSFGIYATPRKLAKLMASNLPVEEIRLENLYFLDGTCGSGSLLTAGHKRIYNLLPVYKSESEKHGFLSNHIFGIDQDPFAAEIAGLSLLHESLPSGNSWKIYKNDFTQTQVFDLPNRPFFILANPPWREDRRESHLEKAIPFISKNLDLLVDHGLMSIILPETFLEKSSCHDIRKRILDECEILEIWQLPEGIFEESSSATAVLFLRKNFSKAKSFPVRIKRVLNEDRMSFINNGHTSFSYIYENQNDWKLKSRDFQIIPNVFQKLWERLEKFKTLGEVAEIRNGITPGPGREDHFCHDQPPEGWKKWLNGPSAIRPFKIEWEQQPKGFNRPLGNRFINWPGNLERPRMDLKGVFEAKDTKIIVNARRNPNTRWRMTAAIDDVGYFPSYALDIIYNLKSNVQLEELTSILNHAVTNAWIDDHIRSRNFDITNLKKIPIPPLNEQQKNELKRLVRELMQNPDRDQCHQILKQIDDITDKAYGLTDDEKLILKSAGFVREKTDVSSDLKKTFPDRTWIITGIVEAVDAKKNIIKIWFSGFGENAIEIDIPKEMPGWALRNEVAFEAEIPFEDRYHPDWSRLHHFRPVRYGYMDETELLKNLETRG
jgi:type I restriction-modification system DNA methylase subunit